MLDERYANEQEQLIREIETLEATIAAYENRQQSSKRFIALLDKYERFDPLTTTMLNEFVEKNLVHERARKGSGAQKKYEDKVRAKKKAEREAKSAALRADAIARGVFIPVSQLPTLAPGEQRSKTAQQFEKTSSGGMKREQVDLYPRWR